MRFEIIRQKLTGKELAEWREKKSRHKEREQMIDEAFKMEARAEKQQAKLDALFAKAKAKEQQKERQDADR